MCNFCRRTPCSSGCPNAKEPVAEHQCEVCGDDIMTGDNYINYEGEIICERCYKKPFVEYLKHNKYAIIQAGEEVYHGYI